MHTVELWERSGVRKLRGRDIFATLENCDGFYETPRNPDGSLAGPLVGYAGKYLVEGNGNPSAKHYVGYAYYNWAKAEVYPRIRLHFAHALVDQISRLDIDVVVGMPMGGLLMACILGDVLGVQTVFLEKKVVAPASAGGREASRLVLNRHEIPQGAKVLIMEDTVNNLSTPNEALPLIEASSGAEVVGMAAVINRSPNTTFTYGLRTLPIISVGHRPMPQYRQDDPEVAEAVRAGNVVWKPKDEWPRLMQAMKQGGRTAV